MKNMTRIAIVLTAAAALTGCSTVRKLGLSEELDGLARTALITAVPVALASQGLPPDLISAEEATEVVDIMTDLIASSTRLDEIGLQASDNPALQSYAQRAISKYLTRDLDEPTAPDPEKPQPPQPETERGWPMEVSRWCGQNASNATLDPRVTLDVSPDGRNWDLRVDGNPSGSKGPSHWAKERNGSAVCCIWYQLSDGTWMGGKFEWYRTTRDFGNLKTGYKGHRLPTKGTPIKYAVHSPDGQWRSPIVDATMQ